MKPMTCIACGKELTHNQKYCSRSCKNSGKNNPMFGRCGNGWRGDDVGVENLHRWLRKNKPKPLDGKCEICDEVPYYDLANVTGTYNRDFSNWMYLCRKCHKSIYHSGKNHHMYGKPKSLKTIKKPSAVIKKGYCSGRRVWNKGKTGVFSDQVLKTMSAARKSKIPWNKDKPWSLESRMKMSESAKVRLVKRKRDPITGRYIQK